VNAVAALVTASAMSVLLLTSLFACGRLPRAGHAPPLENVLLVTLDTVRADRLGSYGCTTAETPSLDALAREGARFEQALAAAPLTLPSHATLLTGTIPPRHGVHQNGTGPLAASVPTLAETFQASGLRTGAFVGSFVLDASFGLARGFEVYDDEIPRDPTALTPGLEAERPAADVVDRALLWLGRDDARPFFAWVHLYDAHAPYEPPEPYRARFAGRPYDGEIAAVDAQVGRLLRHLEERGIADRTVVVVTADHGESLGEHGELTHGLLLFEPTLRVPLLVRAPGRVPAGLVVEEPVALADVAPTVAALLGRHLAMPGSARTQPAAEIDGRDLSAVLAEGREPPRADLYAETEYPRLFGWSGLAALRRGHAKYVHAPSPRLFDLRADPAEATNLLRPGERRQLALAEALATLRAGVAQGGGAPPPASLDAGARAKLEALGYVSGAAAPGGGSGPESPGAADPHDRVALFRSFEEAHWASLEGRPAEAAATLETLVAADPANAVFRTHLARARRDLGDAERSLREYQRAFEMAPGDADAGYELAMALQSAGRFEEATATLVRVLEANASRPEAHNALGILRSQQGDPEAARASFAAAVALDPGDPVLLNNLGNAQRALGASAAAADAYRRSIELAPRYAEPRNGLGAILVAEGRPEQALPLFDAALELAPDRHEIRLNRAVALELLGDRPAAVEAYRDFLSAARGEPELAEQHAVVVQRMSLLVATDAASAPDRDRQVIPGRAGSSPRSPRPARRGSDPEVGEEVRSLDLPTAQSSN
jgi:arylsulfatase A-like enzyme/Flp pilus assembly protein TadD